MTTQRADLLTQVALMAGLYLVGVTTLSAIVIDGDFAAGVFASGLVMLLGAALSAGLLWLTANTSGFAHFARLLFTLKLPLLLAVMWVLFETFSVLPVVVGSAVLMVSVTAHALLTTIPREVADG